MASGLAALFSALGVQAGITLLGFLSSLTGVVTEGRSLSQFVSVVALPCLLLKSMATVDLGAIDWKFVACIALSKLTLVAAGCLLGSALLPGGRFKSAAIGGLLATCSNDIAFGMPLVQALHPDFGFYVVILATLQNAIFNPACFVLMEVGKAREETGSASCHSVVLTAVKRIARNFVVLAVFVGICFNIVFDANLPYPLAKFLGTIGDAFSCTSLFALGMSLAPQRRRMSHAEMTHGRQCVTVLAMSLLKLVISPVVAREYAGLFLPGKADASILADVAWIYGSLPPAPWLAAWSACMNHHPTTISHTVAAMLIAAFPLLVSGSLLLTVSDQTAVHRACGIFSDVCHGLSIAGTGALILPSFIRAVSRSAPLALHVETGAIARVPSWLLYALRRPLPPYVLTLSWLQLGFSAFALLSRVIQPSPDWPSQLCYTISNSARIFAAVACIAVGAAKTAALHAERAVPSIVLSCLLPRRLAHIVLVTVAVAVTLPFALNHSRPASAYPSQMWIIGGWKQLLAALLIDSLVFIALTLSLGSLLGTLGSVEGATVSSEQLQLPLQPTSSLLGGSRLSFCGLADATDIVIGSTPLQREALNERLLMTRVSNGLTTQRNLGWQSFDGRPHEGVRSADLTTASGCEGDAGGAVTDGIPSTDIGRVRCCARHCADQTIEKRSWLTRLLGMALVPGTAPASSECGKGGWREVAILVTLGLRIVLEIALLSAQAADPLHDVISSSTLGHAFLVMFMLTVGLTDGQGFITCLLYLPRFFKRSSLVASPSQPTLGYPDHGS